MSSRSLYPLLRPVYLVPRDDLASDLLIPILRSADDVRCMVALNSSLSFSQLAPGLAAFANCSRGAFHLLISPKFEGLHRQAIERGTQGSESLLVEAANQLFQEGLTCESALSRHAVQCFAYLVSVDRAELRFVLARHGVFRPKVWIVSINHSFVVAHGSSDASEPGLPYNYETVSVERSWVETAKADLFSSLFNGVWNGLEPKTLTIGLPHGVTLFDAPADCPSVDDYWKAWHEDAAVGLAPPLPAHATLSTALV